MKKLLLISLLFVQAYTITSDDVPSNPLKKQEAYQCKEYPDCNKTFKDPSGLWHHMKTIHEGKTYPCEGYPDCNKTFKSYSGLSKHIKKHEGKTYPCEGYPDCNKTFKTRSDLSQHVATIHERTTYPCTYFGCNETFKSRNGLWSHKKKHEGKDRDRDADEGATVKRKKETPQESVAYSTSTITKAPSSSILKNNQDVLNSNDLYQQKNKDKNEYTEDRNKTYDCEHLGCSKTFATPGGLGYHIRTEHNENQMYECSYHNCNQICITPSSLWDHMKKHESRMHECAYPFCSKTFATPDELSYHARTEHAEKRSLENDKEEDDDDEDYVNPHLMVSDSDMAFKKNDDLRKNNVAHVEKKPFSCNQCESSYSRVDALEKHIKAIHQGLRYKCSMCEYISSDESNIKRHLKKSAHEKMTITNISLLDNKIEDQNIDQ